MAKFVGYNEVSLYRSSFPYILSSTPRVKISLVIPMTSLFRRSLHRSSTVQEQFKSSYSHFMIADCCTAFSQIRKRKRKSFYKRK